MVTSEAGCVIRGIITEDYAGHGEDFGFYYQFKGIHCRALIQRETILYLGFKRIVLAALWRTVC